MGVRLSAVVRCIVVAAVAAMVLAAGASAGSASTDAAKPKKGGTFTFLFNSEPPGMDPIQLREIANISPAMAATSIFDELVYTDPVTLKVLPKIAQSLGTSDKGLTWTMKLHSGVRFSDGTAYDAAAVQYNWQRVADPVNRVPFAAVAQQIATYSVVDPLTLKVTLKAADPLFDQKIARNLAWIGSPTALKADAKTFQTKPVGAGPYLLKEWIRGVSTTYVRNPDYWQKGKPYIDTILTKFITDDTQRANTLTSGGAQGALEGAYQNIQQYQASGKYDTLHTPTYGGGYGFGMNISKAPFDDIRVRQAMALTLNAADITARSQYGGKEDVIATVDLKSSPFYDPKLKMPKTDIPAAQKLVDAYVAEHGGKPIEFTYLSFNTPNFVRMGQAVQAVITSSLKNVNVKIDVQEPVAGVPREASGDYQAAQLGPRWTDPAIDMPVYFQTGASQNYMRWSNPAVDAALNQMLNTTDPKVTLAAHHTVVENVLKDLPIVWIVRANVYYALEKAAIGGWKMFYELRPIIEDVYLKKPSA